MTQVGNFGNYSQNQFLFLSGGGSNLKKENNQNIRETILGRNIESTDDITEFSTKNSSSLTDLSDDSLSFDEETFLKNNPFAELVEDKDSITSSFSKMFSNILSVFSRQNDKQIPVLVDGTITEDINLEDNETIAEITSDNLEE